MGTRSTSGLDLQHSGPGLPELGVSTLVSDTLVEYILQQVFRALHIKCCIRNILTFSSQDYLGRKMPTKCDGIHVKNEMFARRN